MSETAPAPAPEETEPAEAPETEPAEVPTPAPEEVEADDTPAE